MNALAANRRARAAYKRRRREVTKGSSSHDANVAVSAGLAETAKEMPRVRV